MTSSIIFTDLKTDFDMHYKQPAEDQSYTSFMSHDSWTTYNRIFLQSMQNRKFACMCMLTHSEAAKTIWGGTQGPFDSCRGWGCLVCQAPSEGLFNCVCFTTPGGRTKASCVCLNRWSHAASGSVSAATVPAEHAFRNYRHRLLCQLILHNEHMCASGERQSQQCSRSSRSSCAM